MTAAPRSAFGWVLPLAFLGLCLGSATIPARAADDVAQMMDSAIKLYDQGNYKKAMRLFLNVINADPNNADAKEYRNRCMDKIVEGELGVRVEKPSKVPNLPGPGLRAPGAAPTPGAPRSIRTFRPQFRPGPRTAGTAKGKGKKPTTTVAADKPTAKDILAQRDALVEDYRRKVLGKESPVWLDDKRNEIEVVLYMNRIFLPMTDQLTTDSYPMLEAAAAEIRANPKKAVFLRAVDNMSPAVRHTMIDLPARRSAIVFSYFVHSTLGDKRPDEPSPALTPDDLAD
ncbi:MAG: hypothetical protein IPP68_09410 [Elusimicrobia bacterium]|nr:hypothetical protein [Elusimicrobiota bacterium]